MILYETKTKYIKIGEVDSKAIDLPEKVFDILKPDFSPEEERVIVLVLNNQLGLIKKTLFIGGLTGCLYDPKKIFTFILKNNGCRFILAHNHPSGNLHPSEKDINIAEKIKKAADLLNLDFVDNVIFTSEGFYSFMQEGLLKKGGLK